MEITQLQYFRTVAETGSFTRAAEKLHMTQSALSKSIARLEEEIGVRLFEREGNRITLNRFGQQFLRDSEPVMRQLSDCVRSVREMAGLEQGDVRIAISKDVFVDHIVQQFLHEHPNASVHCYLLTPDQIKEALEKGVIDLAITTLRPIGTDLLWQDLYRDRLEVLVGRTHPLAGASALHLEQLRNERFIVTNSNYNMDNVIHNLCVMSGFEPRIMYEGTTNDMPMQFIDDGSAVMITPRSISLGVGQILPKNDRILRIPLIDDFPEMRKTMGVAFKQGHYQSAATQEFYDQLVEFYSSIE